MHRAKNAIDTFIYRGGDAISGWIYEGLKIVGLGVAGVAFVAAPLAFLGILGLTLEKYQESLRGKNAEQKTKFLQQCINTSLALPLFLKMLLVLTLTFTKKEKFLNMKKEYR